MKDGSFAFLFLEFIREKHWKRCYRIGESVAEIIRISEPIKKHWAKKMDLNLEELSGNVCRECNVASIHHNFSMAILFAGSGPLKEDYRKEMIIWSDKVRTQLPTFFCLEAFKTG